MPRTALLVAVALVTSAAACGGVGAGRAGSQGATTLPPAAVAAPGTAPPVTAPPSTAPTSTAPTSTVPPTTVPPTTVPPTTVPPTTVPPTTAPPTTAPPAAEDDGALRPGEEGPAVVGLQQRLSDLGYWLGEPDGHYGRLTEQAVMAFQKVEGLARDGVAGPATLGALQHATRPAPRSEADGIEIDLERQVLLVVQGGQVRWAINTSTGTAGWRTPPGTFAVEREIDGLRRAPLGNLYRPKYFHRGIAVHGSPSIPAHPASHGCARVTNAAMDLLWSSGAASIGTEVRVY